MSQRKERLTIETLKSEKVPAKVLSTAILAPSTDFSAQAPHDLIREILNRTEKTLDGILLTMRGAS